MKTGHLKLHRQVGTSHSAALELQATYYSLVELIVQSKYEETAESLRQLRDSEVQSDKTTEALRRLIAIRLAMKRGDPTDETSWLDAFGADQSWIGAECFFVRGQLDFHHQQHESGTRNFREAEKRFKSFGMHDRSFLAAFNAIIGEFRFQKLAPQEKLSRLRELELHIRNHGEAGAGSRVLAMVLRQKSYLFEDLGRFHASVEEISKAIAIFEFSGPVSDYHLALLHASDLCLDLGEPFRAKSFMEYVVTPVDARVEFPLAYVRWRLGGEMPDPDAYSVLSPGWKEKFESLSKASASSGAEASGASSFLWNLESGTIQIPNEKKTMKVKPASMEGRLLRLLMQEKASKALLIETLWPEQSAVELLDNRLHRMIFRLNRKLQGIIHFDGKSYRLKSEIRSS